MLRARQVLKGRSDSLVLRGLKDLLAQPVLKAKLEPLVFKDHKVLKVKLEQLVFKDHKVHRVKLEQLVFKDHKDHKEK